MSRGRGSTEREFHLDSMDFEQSTLAEDHSQSDQALSHKGQHAFQSGLSNNSISNGRTRGRNDSDNDHAQEPEDVETGSAGEKDGDEGESSNPVGFWHKSLKKTRLDVFKNYIFICMLSRIDGSHGADVTQWLSSAPSSLACSRSIGARCTMLT